MKFILALLSLFFVMLFSVSAALADGSQAANDLLDVLKAKGILDDASYGKLKEKEAASATPAAQTIQLLDVLKAKGIVSEEDYKRISEEAAPAPATAAAAASAPAPVPAAATTTAPVPVASSAAPERPFNGALTNFEEGFARLSGDKVKLKIGALFQGGWLYDDSGIVVGSPPTTQISSSSATKHIDNSFFVRRARLFFTGQIFDKTGFKISIEGTGASPLLQDAYAYFDYIPYARVTFGQFKTPLSVEQGMSIGDIPTINRSLVTNMIVNPTLRDLGIMLSGAYRINGKPFGVGYATALFNGNGKNNVDDNNRKDWTGRVWINPFVPGLTLGGAWYMGDTKNETGSVPKDRDHQKWGADFEYHPTMVKGLGMMGEFEWERRFYDTYVSKNIFNTTTPNAFGRSAHTFGYYLSAWYRVDGLGGPMGYLNGFEPVIRYDFLDEDMSGTANDRFRWTFGANYYLNSYVRMAVNWEAIHAESGLAANSLEKIDLKSHHLFTTLLQIKF